jgi:TldD protein
MAFDSLDRLEQAVLDACRCADLVGTGRTQLCELAPVVSESRADLKNDWRGVSVEDKLDLIRRYDRLILKQDDQIESSGVGYIDQFATVYFANSLGSYIVQETPQLALHWHAVARDGALVQRTHDSVASVDDFAALADVEHVIAETAHRHARSGSRGCLRARSLRPPQRSGFHL